MSPTRLIIGAVVAAALGLFYYFTRRKAEGIGEEIGGLEEDKKRAKEAENAADDDAVLREWRKQAFKK